MKEKRAGKEGETTDGSSRGSTIATKKEIALLFSILQKYCDLPFRNDKGNYTKDSLMPLEHLYYDAIVDKFHKLTSSENLLKA